MESNLLSIDELPAMSQYTRVDVLILGIEIVAKSVMFRYHFKPPRADIYHG